MPERITFVVEFDGPAPTVSVATEILGGRLVAVAFEDALSEPRKPELAVADLVGKRESLFAA